MDPIFELMALMGERLPENLLVEAIQKDATAYLETGSKENQEKLLTSCFMWLTGMTAKHHKGGADGMIAHIKKQKEMVAMVNPDRPKN